jgi:hypothetical protein
MHRSYIGTFRYDPNNLWKKMSLTSREDVFSRLSDVQQRWLENNAPDWKFWHDEFRRLHYHIYSETPISDSRLTMAGMIFYQEIPSHPPLGEEALWVDVFKS